MLGRTANGIYWMCRYLERAENTARLIDAGLRLTLTRDEEASQAEWRSIVQTAGLSAAYEAVHEDYAGRQVWNFILRDKENPVSVREMLGSVRTNARLARTVMSTDVWEAINTSWMELDRMLTWPVGQASVSEVVRLIRRAGTLVHGAMAGSMLRNEAFHFGRAGTFIERADSTARLLDIKYYLLLPSLGHVGSSLDSGQWETVLRSVSGDRAYSWLNAGEFDARGIAEFLVLDDRFPRSLAFCHRALALELDALAKLHGSKHGCDELMQSSVDCLNDLSIEDVFEQGLHEWLVEFTGRNSAIAEAIASDYRFLA